MTDLDSFLGSPDHPDIQVKNGLINLQEILDDKNTWMD